MDSTGGVMTFMIFPVGIAGFVAGIPGIVVFYTKNAEIPGITSLEVWLPMISVGSIAVVLLQVCSENMLQSWPFERQFQWLGRLTADAFLTVPILFGILFIFGTLTMPFFPAYMRVARGGEFGSSTHFGKFIVAWAFIMHVSNLNSSI
jgi:hypothetical protein